MSGSLGTKRRRIIPFNVLPTAGTVSKIAMTLTGVIVKPFAPSFSILRTDPLDFLPTCPRHK